MGLLAELRRAAWRRHGSGKRSRADCQLLGAANGPTVIPSGGRTGCGCRRGRFPAWPRAGAAGSAGSGGIPIKHVIVDCQENRSFDHYYGFAPFAGRYGVPAGYSQPDGQGGVGHAIPLHQP